MSVSDPSPALVRPSPPSCRIRVDEDGPHLAVRAVERIGRGEIVLQVVGHEVARPTRYSLQIGWHAHLAGPVGLPPHMAVSEYGWRFVNHSCAPNAYLAGMDLIALVDIDEGAEVTFDYNATEWELAHPFECACGAASCVGTVKGFRHLDEARRERLRPCLPSYLRAKIRGKGAPRST